MQEGAQQSECVGVGAGEVKEAERSIPSYNDAWGLPDWPYVCFESTG